MSEGYSADIRWKLLPDCEFAITDFNDDWASIEETRKNGQEDEHIYLEAKLVDGKWVLTEGREHLASHWGDQYCTGIEDHLNKYGLPE